MPNLYKMSKELIKLKEEFNSKYSKQESTYNKKDRDCFEEYIINLEADYIEACNMMGDEPIKEALYWFEVA